MRLCLGCQVEKLESEFHRHPKGRDGLQSHCKQCQREYKRTQRIVNPIKFRDEHYKRKYGITSVDYVRMLQEQDGKCKICGTSVVGDGRARVFSIDHDHQTGFIRGLLCVHCNHGLAGFRDNQLILEAAIRYLREAANVSTPQ